MHVHPWVASCVALAPAAAAAEVDGCELSRMFVETCRIFFIFLSF